MGLHWNFYLCFAVPILFAISGWMVWNSPRLILYHHGIGTVVTTFTIFWVAIIPFFRHSFSPLFTNNQWFFVDSLSAFHLIVFMIILTLISLFSIGYFAKEIQNNQFSLKIVRRYNFLWFLSLVSIILVLFSNDLGLVWVATEATTLFTASLICIHPTTSSLEAMWKYLILCSVGIALAFIGTILFVGAQLWGRYSSVPFEEFVPQNLLLWSHLIEHTRAVNPTLLKASFIFLVIGYGTKAGLAPMHSWLPDAHSQAPAPISAMLSAVTLNAVLYVILRYLPIVEMYTEPSWSNEILIILGILSILLSAIFIGFQKNVKRLLAYSSIEHIGIMSLGIGIGGIGTVAALFHLLNHSFSKSLAFFSTGILGQYYGSYDIDKIKNITKSSPILGIGLGTSGLSLLGVAPFATFFSEWLILQAIWEKGCYLLSGAFLLGLSVIFIGVTRHLVSMIWEKSEKTHPFPLPYPFLMITLILSMITPLILLGLWMPETLSKFLDTAATLIHSGR